MRYCNNTPHAAVAHAVCRVLSHCAVGTPLKYYRYQQRAACSSNIVKRIYDAQRRITCACGRPGILETAYKCKVQFLDNGISKKVGDDKPKRPLRL